MVTKKRWTSDEERVVISKVTENTGNLTEAFKQAAIELDRTVPSVQYRWYNVISKKSTSKVFITYSGKSVVTNRKNIDKSVPLKKNIFNKIIDFIFGK